MRGREEPEPSRRNFLKGVLAFGATAMVSGKVLATTKLIAPERMPINLERQKRIDDMVAAARSELQSPALQEALQGRGDDPLPKILQVLQKVSISTIPHLEETTYDVNGLRKFPAQVEITSNTGKVSTSNSGILDFGDEQFEATAAHPKYGSDFSDYPVPGVDVVMRRLEKRAEGEDSERVIKVNPNLTDADIDARFVAVVGEDDSISKVYAGMTIRITSGLADVLAQGDKELAQRLQGSFMVLLPHGEKRSSKGDRTKPSLVAEMTGASVFAHDGKAYDYAGNFSRAFSTEGFQGEEIGLGFFTGIDGIRRAKEAEEARLS